MKYKNYILILLISLFIGCNDAYAAGDPIRCYYIADDLKISINIKTSEYLQTNIYVAGGVTTSNDDAIQNWFPDGRSNKTRGGDKFENIYKIANDAREAYKNNTMTCPNYLVLQKCETNGLNWDSFLTVATFNLGYEIYATNDMTFAQKATININEVNGCVAYYASYKNASGTPYTANDYYGTSPDVEVGGEDVEIDCGSIFGDKKDPDSIAYIINEILTYVRIIVPILIILLGIIDLGKAVMASKEDEMRKAQKTFIMRLIAGLAVFFVPLLVDIVMYLADIVWEGLGYSSCNI